MCVNWTEKAYRQHAIDPSCRFTPQENLLCIVPRDRLSMLVAGAHPDDARLITSATQDYTSRRHSGQVPEPETHMATTITDAVQSSQHWKSTERPETISSGYSPSQHNSASMSTRSCRHSPLQRPRFWSLVRPDHGQNQKCANMQARALHVQQASVQ